MGRLARVQDRHLGRAAAGPRSDDGVLERWVHPAGVRAEGSDQPCGRLAAVPPAVSIAGSGADAVDTRSRRRLLRAGLLAAVSASDGEPRPSPELREAPR